jgi:hypothetical protein
LRGVRKGSNGENGNPTAKDGVLPGPGEDSQNDH